MRRGRGEGMVLTAKAMSTAELVEDCAPLLLRALRSPCHNGIAIVASLYTPYTPTKSITQQGNNAMSSPPSNAAAAAAGTKKPIVNPYQRQNSHPNNNESTNAGPPPAKRLKTPEDDPTDSATNSLTEDEEQALLLANELSEIPSEFKNAVKNTMRKYFAHSSFRPGQLTVLHSILVESKDACVFWATGAGKSLVYQLPPLHLQNQIAIQRVGVSAFLFLLDSLLGLSPLC